MIEIQKIMRIKELCDEYLDNIEMLETTFDEYIGKLLNTRQEQIIDELRETEI